MVATDRGVSSVATTLMGTPPRISSVARLCRSMCGVNHTPVAVRSRSTSLATA